MKEVKVEYVNLDENNELDKFDELIKKQEEKEEEMRKVYENYVNSDKQMEELEETLFPRKQITVKLFPNTHKRLKVMATSKDTTLEKIATSIVENNIDSMDFARYVTDEIAHVEDYATLMAGFNKSPDYTMAQYGSDLMDDYQKADYDRYAVKLKIGNPRKRVNVKVHYDTHIKLKIMAAIQDRSLNNIVSSIIEEEIGEPDEIDFDKLTKEIIKFENIDEDTVDIDKIKDKLNLE